MLFCFRSADYEENVAFGTDIPADAMREEVKTGVNAASERAEKLLAARLRLKSAFFGKCIRFGLMPERLFKCKNHIRDESGGVESQSVYSLFLSAKTMPPDSGGLFPNPQLGKPAKAS